MNVITQLLTSVFELFEKLLGFLFEFVETSISAIPKRNETYNATFMRGESLLSRREKGFCLTGRRNLSVQNSFMNALVIGGTGVGKSSIVLMPSLYTMNGSYIIHDPSGELFNKCAGYLSKNGYEIKVLNFAKPTSTHYCPLARANSSSEIQKVASMLVENALGTKGKDPFWSTQSVALLSILISLLKKQEPQYQNLYNVRHLLNLLGSEPKAIDALFSSTDVDEVLFNEYKSFISYDEKIISGVIASCKAALQIFNDEMVAHVTANDNISFQDFREKPVALFIQNSISDQRYYSVLTSIFFEQFFGYLLSRFPEKKEKDVFLLIDECGSLSIPTLPLAICNVRKMRAGCMLLIQDYSQLIHNYGQYDAATIKSNCFAKLYFTGQSLETTKELEQILGKYEFKDKEDKKVVRSLMTSDEVRTMRKDHALLICGHYLPIYTKLRPYYKNSRFNSYNMLPITLPQNTFENSPLPLLPISKN